MTRLYLAGHILAGRFFSLVASHSLAVAALSFVRGERLCFALLLTMIAYRGTRSGRPDRWLAFAGLLLVMVGMYAEELTLLQLPSLWMLYGTGVSQTQFACAPADVAFLALLLERLTLFLRRHSTCAVGVREPRDASLGG